MLDINSMDLSQLKTVLSTVTTQIAVYKTYISSASKIYGNIMSKINIAKSGLADAKQTLANAKSNIKNKKIESPIPDSLMVTENTNSDISTNNIELACLQISKDESVKKINKYTDLASQLEEWKQKLEQKISVLEQKISENAIISEAKSTIAKVQSTVNNAQSEANTLITKVTDAQNKTTTIIQNNNLTKVI